MEWKKLYNIAKEKQNPRQISSFIEAGSVSSAILTKSGNVYTGVCIDTACSLGMCAERNAIANMITNSDNEIVKLICITSDGKVGSPCGACREYLMQLHKNSQNIEILVDLDTQSTVKLGELIPDWWGQNRFN